MDSESHHPHPYEDELLVPLRRGDANALNLILRRFGARVRHALYLRFGDRLNEHDLEDVMSIGLFRLWTARNAFDPLRARLETWFYVLCRNAAVELLRRRARQVPTRPLGDVPAAPDSEAVLGNRQKGLTEQADPLAVALGRAVVEVLTPREQRVIEAYLAADGAGSWSVDVARELKLSPQHVRVIRLRAFGKLRRAIGMKGAKQ